MGRKKVFLLAVSLVLTSLFASFVLAQQQQGDTFKLTEIFKTIEGFDVFEAYKNFPFLIDTLIYFLFFISIAMATLGKHFSGSGGKGVVIAAGLALSVGISFWAKSVGFKLGNLGPLAALIFALVIGIWIYRIVRGDREAGAGVWISIIVIWVAFNMFFPQLVSTLQGNKWGSLLLGVLTILFIIALPMAAVQFFKGSGGGGREEGGRWEGLWPGGGRREPETPEERRERGERGRERDLLRSEGKLIDRILNTDIRSLNRDTQIRDLLEQIHDALGSRELISNKPRILQKLRSLANAVENGEKINKGVYRILEENKRLLRRIYDLIEHLSDDDKRNLRNELKKKLGERSHVEAYNQLIEAAKISMHREKISAFLTEKIEAENTQRINFFREMKTKLDEAIEELSKDEPNYDDIRSSLKEAIDIIVQVIRLDNDIIKREREMYKENKFMERILEVPTPGTPP